MENVSQQRLRVEQLASVSGLSVDTIRYYQRRGLLPPPRRVGRHAEYEHAHVERLAEIRHLAREGFTLAQIHELGDLPSTGLGQLAGNRPTLTRSEVAEQAGVPEGLVALLVDNGLLRPFSSAAKPSTTKQSGSPRFDQNAVTMVQAGLVISEAGIPLQELIRLASDHAEHTEEIVNRAIDLFQTHTMETLRASEEAHLVEIIQTLLPVVVRLIAGHFHQSLTAEARNRLQDGAKHTLADALSTAHELEIRCEWI